MTLKKGQNVLKNAKKLLKWQKSPKNGVPDDVDVHRKLVRVTHYHQDVQYWLVLAQGFWIGVWMNHSHPNVQEGTLILGVLNGDHHRLGTVNHLYEFKLEKLLGF